MWWFRIQALTAGFIRSLYIFRPAHFYLIFPFVLLPFHYSYSDYLHLHRSLLSALPPPPPPLFSPRSSLHHLPVSLSLSLTRAGEKINDRFQSSTASYTQTAFFFFILFLSFCFFKNRPTTRFRDAGVCGNTGGVVGVWAWVCHIMCAYVCPFK